jgi:predicted RND superfamily exporter protein
MRWIPALSVGLTSRGWAWLVGGALLTAAGLWSAMGLGFDGSFLGLLPDDAPEVRDARVFAQHVGSSSEVVAVVSGGADAAARLAWAKGLAVRLRGMEGVMLADAELPVEFFEDRALWLLTISELRQVEELLWGGVAGSLAGRPDPWAALRAFAQALAQGRGAGLRRVYTSADVGAVYVPIKLGVSAADDAVKAQALLTRLIGEIERLDPEASGVAVEVVGRLLVSLDENRRLARDAGWTSLLSFILCVLLVAAATRRARSPLVLAVPLVVGVIWTLGLARWLVGSLNLVSGLMVPVLVGLGIDFSAHLLHHYLRGLDEEGLEPLVAMRAAIRETLSPCLAGGLTTAAAFFTLTISSYDGIVGYGLLAGLGVLVMFVANYALVPVLALWLLRRPKPRPVPASGVGEAVMSVRMARGLLWGAGVLAGAGLILSFNIRYFNDFQALRGEVEVERRAEAVSTDMGGPLEPSLVWTNNMAEAKALSDAAAARIAAGDPWLARSLSVADLVPWDIDAKEPIIKRLRAAAGLIPQRDGQSAQDLQRLRVMLAAEPWALADVPLAFRSRLQLDAAPSGTPGDPTPGGPTPDGPTHNGPSIALLWPSGETDNDDKARAWLASLDQTLTDAGLRGAPVLDINRVVERMSATMLEDIPKLIVAVAAAMLLLLALHLRRRWDVLGAFGSLGAGLLLLIVAMRALGMTFNILNVVVLPTLIGIGIDNAIHLLHGYRVHGPGSLRLVLHRVGRPAALASATTAIGFGALSLALHPGIRGVGVLSILGIGAMFFTTTVLVVAALQLRQGVAARRA